MTYNGCLHESWDCHLGDHTCNDCRKRLGSRTYVLEPHAVLQCEICMPTSSCVHDEREICSVCTREIEARLGPAPKFVTKDSGKRESYVSGMVRDTQEGKPRFDLLLVPEVPYEAQFLTRFAALLERGAEKYGERNWQKADSVEELERFVASGLRHMVQWVSGEVDEDHAAAVAFNLMAAEYVKWKLEQNEDPAL